MCHLCIRNYGQGTKQDDPFTLKKSQGKKKIDLVWTEVKVNSTISVYCSSEIKSEKDNWIFSDGKF